jgi:CheY-like chemotaxis protein
MQPTTSIEGKSRYRYILIVDNKTNDLFYASMLLQRLDCRGCSAHTAAEALEMTSVAVPSLVIANLFLPGMSGMDLARLLKQDPRTASLPVIFLIPSNDKTAEKRCLTAGVAAYITKPIAVEDLHRIVQKIMESTPRANIRIPTRLSVSLNKVPLDCIEGECASVLSEHGMYVRMLKPYNRDERLTIEMNVNGRIVPAEAAVLYSHRFGDGPFREPGMGLTFLRISSEDQNYIRRFIHDEVTRGIL